MRQNSFVGHLQVFNERTATTLKGTVVVPYPIPIVQLNFSWSFRRWIIEKQGIPWSDFCLLGNEAVFGMSKSEESGDP